MPRKTKKQVTAEAKLEGKLRASSRQKLDTDRKYRAIQDENARLRQSRDDALEITNYRPKPKAIKCDRRRKDGEATAFALLSDVHCEELVPKEKVNYLNEHTPDISKRRVHRFHELVIEMIRAERQLTKINNLVLWWGGDFFTSDMHGAPTAFPPMVAAMFAQDMLADGLKFLINNEPKLKIHVVGSVGNHSRKDTGKRVNKPLEQEFSIEWMMYHNLKTIFEGYPNVTFQFDNSYQSYVTVYDKVIRFNHGHHDWRYNDGMGGVHGPLWKVITQKWDKQIKSDLTCVGHYHQYTPAASLQGRNYMVNGSTIGAAPYGMGFGYEDPMQAFFCIHNQYGLVAQKPLFVNT